MYSFSGCVLQAVLLTIVSTSELFSKDGVLIINNGKASVASVEWSVILSIDQPTPPNVTEWASRMVDIVDSQAKRAPLQERRAWIHRIEAIVHAANVPTTLQETMTERRQKRGLFDFVGKIAKAGFGLATESDVRKIQDALETLRAAEEDTHHNEETFITVLNQTRRYVRENRQDINILDQNQRTLNALAVNNSKSIFTLIKNMSDLYFTIWMYQEISQMESCVKEYDNLVKIFKLRVDQLHNGWLLESIVMRDQLEAILVQIRKQGQQVLPIDWYYENTRLSHLGYSPRSMLFQFKVYGVTNDVYVLYSFMYFNVPLGVDHVRKLSGKTKIAIDSASTASFTPDNCVGTNPALCIVSHVKLIPCCEYHLVAGIVDNNCKVEIAPMPNVSIQTARPFENKNLLVLAPTKTVSTTLRCKGLQPVVTDVSKPTMQMLQPGCTLDADNLRLASLHSGNSAVESEADTVVAAQYINVSWPEKPPQEVQELLRLQHTVAVPMATLNYPHTAEPVIWHKSISFPPIMVLLIIIVGGVAAAIYFRKKLIDRFQRCSTKEREYVSTKTTDVEEDRPGIPSIYPSLGVAAK